MQWIPFLSFVLAACYTPGPNIILAMNTARLFGFRKTIPLMTGMTVGLFAVMMLNAVGNLFIGAFIPKVLPWLRGIGSIYLFWLAWKIAFPKKPSVAKGNDKQRSAGKSSGNKGRVHPPVYKPESHSLWFHCHVELHRPMDRLKTHIPALWPLSYAQLRRGFHHLVSLRRPSGTLLLEAGPPDLADNGSPSGLVRLLGFRDRGIY